MQTEPVNIEFNAATHTYMVNGVTVPGVTEVLRDVGIIDYSHMPNGVRTEALERGRNVHSLTQYWDENDLGTFPDELAGYLDAWKRFRDQYKFEPRVIEKLGYHAKFQYCGILDREGSASTGDLLVDIKTNTAPPWTQFQTAAYAAFFSDPAKRQRMAVELHDDGTFKVYPYRCAEYAADMNVFHAALTIYRAKRRA